MENRFAAARRRYLRTHMDGIYTGMLLTGTLEPHLAEIGESAQAMFDRLVEQIIEFDLDEGRMDYLDDMIDVFSKDGCEMVDILFDRFLKKYYADIDVSNERMTINLTDEEGHVLSFNLSQSEVHYVLHMVERRLNSFMRDDGGGGFSDED